MKCKRRLYLAAVLAAFASAAGAQSALVTERTLSVNAAMEAARAGALHLERIATAAGGLPIRAGDTVVGAIGISGSSGVQGIPGGTRDEACAQAGIDRIAKGLGG